MGVTDFHEYEIKNTNLSKYVDSIHNLKQTYMPRHQQHLE